MATERTSRICQLAVSLAARLIPALAICGSLGATALAGWSVDFRGSVALSAGPLSDIRELSGVTYLGPQAGGLERFAAIQDENQRMVVFDASFAASGAINSATAVSAVTVGPNLDYEGIAFTGPVRNSVFVSEESTPTVHEFKLDTGELLQTLSMPPVFLSDRSNRGLESLTRSVDGDTMWTANEEALTIDGPQSSTTQANWVRLQRIADDGTQVDLGPQFAYAVDPIHAGSNGANDRSGLSDLVMLPDDTLLALERSAAAALPPFHSRIYQVDFAGATDVSGGGFAAGLAGQPFAPVGKSLLWSGAVGTPTNGNLEGVGLGPVLENGNWLLMGVLDNGGSGSNLIVSFELSLTGCSLNGDYNCNGAVDDADYSLWKNTFGSSKSLTADGNDNGIVDAADYVVWRDNLAVSSLGSAAAVPEPGTTWLLTSGLLAGAVRRRLRWH